MSDVIEVLILAGLFHYMLLGNLIGRYTLLDLELASYPGPLYEVILELAQGFGLVTPDPFSSV